MAEKSLENLTEQELLDLLKSVRKHFLKYFIRSGDESTTVFFFNTKASVTANVNITNKLLSDYKIDLHILLR